MTYIFSQSMQAFKTEVKIKHLPGAVVTRIVQEMEKGIGRGRYGRGDSGIYGGRGRESVRFGHSRGRQYIPKLGSKVITLINWKKIDYHTSVKFSGGIYHQMTTYQRKYLQRERK